MADRETSSTESLVQYFANLPELERDVLRRLSVLHWFDRALYEYIQDMDSPLEFEQVTRLAAMSPLNRTTQRERFVIIPDLRRKLAADLREERYEEYITVNRLAASYFHRPLSHVDSTTVGDVIEELGYLAVADPDQAALRLAMFARAALLSGWAEAASRAARAVGIAPSELSGHSRAFPVARLVDALATILSEAGVGTPSTAGLLSIVGDISIPRNDAEDALVTLAHQALDRFPADRRATGDRSSRIELSSRDSVYAWGRVVEKGFPESVSLPAESLVNHGHLEGAILAQRRDRIEFLGRGATQHYVDVTLTLSALQWWRERMKRPDEESNGMTIAVFPWDSHDVIDSIRVADEDGKTLPQLTASESRALVLAEFLRNLGEAPLMDDPAWSTAVRQKTLLVLTAMEHKTDEGLERAIEELRKLFPGKDTSMSLPQAPLVVLQSAVNNPPRRLLFNFEEFTHRYQMRFSLFGFLVIEYILDIPDLQRQVVDVVTPSGMVSIGASLWVGEKAATIGRLTRRPVQQLPRGAVPTAVIDAERVEDGRLQRFAVTSSALGANGVSNSARGLLRLAYAPSPAMLLVACLVALGCSAVNVVGFSFAVQASYSYPVSYIWRAVIAGGLAVYGIIELVLRTMGRDRDNQERRLLYRHAARPIHTAVVACLVFTGAAVLISSFQVTQTSSEVVFGASLLVCASLAILLVITLLRVSLLSRRYMRRRIAELGR